MMDNCKIVTDLLPSYCDNLTSPESTQLIEAHIAECPDCAGKLGKMRGRQENEVLEQRREEFRRALPLYELNFKIKVLWIVLACAILVIGFFVLQAVSMELALLSNGISLEHMEIVSDSVPNYQGEPENTTYDQLIWSRDKKDKAVLACLRRNFLGFWHVSSLVTADSANGYNPDSYTWIESGWNRHGADFDSFTVAHIVFAGNNAVKCIEYPRDTLPEGAVARVYQKHDHYMIYITAVLEPGTRYAWNVPDILEEYGFIAASAEE